MFGMIKLAIFLVLLLASFTIPLGNRTFAGHMRAIWSSSEGKDLREGVNKTIEDVKEKKTTETGNKKENTAVIKKSEDKTVRSKKIGTVKRKSNRKRRKKRTRQIKKRVSEKRN
jgi:hypothetical protein